MLQYIEFDVFECETPVVVASMPLPLLHVSWRGGPMWLRNTLLVSLRGVVIQLIVFNMMCLRVQPR